MSRKEVESEKSVAKKWETVVDTKTAYNESPLSENAATSPTTPISTTLQKERSLVDEKEKNERLERAKSEINSDEFDVQG